MNKVLVNINQDNTEEEKATARSNIGAAKLVEVQTPMSTYTGDLSLETTSIGSNRIEFKVDNTTFGVLPPVPEQTNVMLVNDSNNEVKWTQIQSNTDSWSSSKYSYGSNIYDMGISVSYNHNSSNTEVMGTITFLYYSPGAGFSVVPLRVGESDIEFKSDMSTQCTNVPTVGASGNGILTLPFRFYTTSSTQTLPDYIGIKGGATSEQGCSVACYSIFTQAR